MAIQVHEVLESMQGRIMGRIVGGGEGVWEEMGSRLELGDCRNLRTPLWMPLVSRNAQKIIMEY